MWRTKINKAIFSQYANEYRYASVLVEVTEYGCTDVYYIGTLFFNTDDEEFLFNIQDMLLDIKEINRYIFLKDLQDIR